MKRTEKLMIALFSSTLLVGVLSGCGPAKTYPKPSNPPVVQGTEEEEWSWDEDNGQWYHSGGGMFWYNGGVHRNSIIGTGIKSTAPFKSTSSSSKSSFFSRSSGFGSSSHSFGG